MPVTPDTVTRSQARRAGQVLRTAMQNAQSVSTDEAGHAIRVASAWRQSHSPALQAARMGLTSMLNTTGVGGRVSQRHKQFGSLVLKLDRQPSMALDRMQDVAGCRAVVSKIDDVYAVWARWSRRGEIHRWYDYIVRPQRSGYRGVHLIVEYHDRLVEIQLRTELQHEWAELVERMDKITGKAMKNGEGPDEALDWLRDLGDLLAHEDAEREPPAELIARVEERERVALESLGLRRSAP